MPSTSDAPEAGMCPGKGIVPPRGRTAAMDGVQWVFARCSWRKESEKKRVKGCFFTKKPQLLQFLLTLQFRRI
jgi:hypothetical protein